MDNQKQPPSKTETGGKNAEPGQNQESKESTSSEKRTFNIEGNVGEPPQEQAKHANEMVDDEE